MKHCNFYNFAFSREIVERFHKTRGRAPKIFRLITNCRPDYPAWLFCHDQTKWNRYKKLLKLIDLLDLDCQPAKVDKHLCSYIEDEMIKKGYFVTYTGIDFRGDKTDI